MSQPIHAVPDFWKGVLLGASGCTFTILFIILALAVPSLQRKDVYDNDHWKLNVKVPFTTMWMNMGYWTNADGLHVTVFETACRNLLLKVLEEAHIFKDSLQSSTLAILDLGVGCGDQSLELARLINDRGITGYRYAGLTLNESQHRLALSRVQSEVSKLKLVDGAVEIFCADAANPDTWNARVKFAVKSMVEQKTGDQHRWVLALDSLYHFFPSRKPILNYAAKNLDASFMAFDLLLSDEASYRRRLLVKLIGLVMGCPAAAFVTVADYTKQLVDAGYDEKHIQFRDITEHVFPGLVNHIQSQSKALRPFGISAGKFKVAAKVFSWFAESKALRGTVVTARKRPKTQ
ncbi:hypothetical protein BDP81DRAFT_378346 [Colletotrichum phormii]|uniref:Uncharacterized protein n=1 Tax=Colletotrichum phormii TaxID=359342 RepID=A0AAI9ZP44_9PEZI|nr:uncharacterized protein BDP81DRAFT_378346 [Colletotrichum phormii]KAK1634202.1 hypothetical protein BDP81DRAFT_378346 [Colletotrichum phormii]